MARRDDDDDDELSETPKMSKAEARSLLVAPGTALQVMACCSIMTFILTGIYLVVVVVSHWSPHFPWQTHVVRFVYLATCILGTGVQIAVVILAGKMKRSSGYHAAMACAILALLPCCSPFIFYLHYLSLGIFCLVILFNQQVKKGFRS